MRLQFQISCLVQLEPPVEEKYRGEGLHLPLLHTMETWKGWDGDKDDNSLLAVANFNLQSDQSQHASSMFLHHRQKTMVRNPSNSDSTTWACFPKPNADIQNTHKYIHSISQVLIYPVCMYAGATRVVVSI